jgi:hypothetical protein
MGCLIRERPTPPAVGIGAVGIQIGGGGVRFSGRRWQRGLVAACRLAVIVGAPELEF